MRLLALVGVLLAGSATAADWVIVSSDARAQAGAPFEVVVIPPPGEPAPDELPARLTVDVAEITLTLRPIGVVEDGRHRYVATMPVSVVEDLSAPVQDSPRRAVIVAIAVLALVAAARRWVLVGARLA